MKIRYLVIDDAPFIRELIISVMKSLGHLCVGEAGDGAEAMELIAQVLPDVIFVDLVLPKQNGVSLSKEIREMWPDGFQIACTTLTPEELPVPADATRFDGWLSKPFSKAQLESLLNVYQSQFPEVRKA